MHRLLKRQLKKLGYSGGDLSEEQFQTFLEMCERAYVDADEDRTFLEHTLEVSSKEMQDLYAELEQKSRTKLAQSEARFRTLAQHDSLTGIANRFSLEERLASLIAYSKRYHQKFALLFLDLDHFKYINDTFGHDFGDKLLKEVVKRISSELRSEDIFARLGGDEFVIVFTNITERSLYKTVEKILLLFREPWRIEDHILNVSTSIGVVFYPKDGKDTQELLKHADIAMYRAKHLGRDNFSFYTKELNEKVMREIELEVDMQQALIRDEFELFYQPKVDGKTNEIIGAEALIRWHHKEFGVLLPDEFIPIAENNGFILKIGEWVIKQACKDIKDFNRFNKDDLHVSVNVSIKQLQVKTLFELIKRNLQDIDSSQLIVEITETILLKDVDIAVEMLNKIRSLGVKISMDDFGTGYSSLSQLSKLPIDSLKIDKLFVDEIPEDGNSAKILINTIIAMANTLDVCLIAEGVEKEYQAQYLLERGCQYYQGYLFAKPMPKKDYIKLIS